MNKLNSTPSQLPRRDIFLLPAISILTIVVMLLGSEGLCRVIWPEQVDDPCLVPDSHFHVRFRPNCKSRTKPAEGPWSDNSYNECGYRTLESCGPKPAGTIRVAVIGASFSFGYGSPYSDIYTTLTANALARQCGRKVEFQNLGIANGSLSDIYRRLDEALALKPDLLLLVAGEGEVTKEIDDKDFAGEDVQPTLQRSAVQVNAPQVSSTESLRHQIFVLMKQSRVALMLQHFMYQDPDTYSKLYLAYGDKADFLRPPFSQRWRQRFSNFDRVLTKMDERAQAASVPMALMISPTQAQLALANSHPWPGVDLRAFPNEVSDIAAQHKIYAIDLLPAFTKRSDFRSLIYTADGHPAPQGQHVIAQVLDDKLLSSGIDAFSGCRQLQ